MASGFSEDAVPRDIADGTPPDAPLPRGLRAALDSLIDPYGLVAPVRDEKGRCVDLTYVYANPAACRYSGMPFEQLMGKRARQLMPARSLPGLLRAYIHVLDTGEPLVLDDFVCPHDQAAEPAEVEPVHGKERRYDIRVAKSGDGLSITWRDVTDRYSSLAALVASEERFRLSMDHAPIGMFLVGADGRFISANPAMCDFLGYDSDELMSKNWEELVHPDDLAGGRQVRDQLAAGDLDSFRVTTRYRHAAGSLKYGDLSITAMRDPQGVFQYFIAQIVDVSEQKAAQTLLVASEERYRLLAENASDLVYLAGIDGTIRWVAGTMTRALGWSPEELVGRGITTLVHPSDRKRIEAEGREWYAGATIPTGTLTALARMRTKAGSYRWMDARVTQVADATGNPTAFVVGMRDVDDLLAARERAESAQESEQQTLAFMERAVIGMAIMDPDGLLLGVNQAFCDLLRYDRPALMGKSMGDLTHPDDRPAALAALSDLARSATESYTLTERYLTSEGDVVWVDLSGAAIRDEAGRPVRIVVQAVDVTAEKSSLEALASSTRRFQILAENASDVVLELDAEGLVRWVSPSIAAVLGTDSATLVGRRLMELVTPDDCAEVEAAIVGARGGQASSGLVARFLTTAGDARDMSMTVRPVPDNGGEAGGAVVGLRDVTDEQRSKVRLARSHALLRLAGESAPQGMAIVDLDGRFVQVNPALSRLLEVPLPHLVGRHLSEFLSPDDRERARASMQRLIARTDTSIFQEHGLVSGPGHTRWVEHSLSLMRDEAGEPMFFVHQFSDQTEARRMRADLSYRATHDALTGVLNRDELIRRLGDRAFRVGVSLRSPIAVLFCDVDNLKPVNDTLGHLAGDAVLMSVAARMRGAVRSSDFVARVGGDEFVVVVDRIQSLDELERVAEKIRSAASQPVDVGGRPLPVSVSIGATVADADDDPDSILSRADEALYRAKRAGRSRIVVDKRRAKRRRRASRETTDG